MISSIPSSGTTTFFLFTFQRVLVRRDDILTANEAFHDFVHSNNELFVIAQR